MADLAKEIGSVDVTERTINALLMEQVAARSMHDGEHLATELPHHSECRQRATGRPADPSGRPVTPAMAQVQQTSRLLPNIVSCKCTQGLSLLSS